MLFACSANLNAAVARVTMTTVKRARWHGSAWRREFSATTMRTG
jgi:hypothetical protein